MFDSRTHLVLLADRIPIAVNTCCNLCLAESGDVFNAPEMDKKLTGAEPGKQQLDATYVRSIYTKATATLNTMRTEKSKENVKQ